MVEGGGWSVEVPSGRYDERSAGGRTPDPDAAVERLDAETPC
jgi:hypothetical protein